MSCGCIFKEERPRSEVNLLISNQYNHRGIAQNANGVIQPDMRVDLAIRDFGGPEERASRSEPGDELAAPDPEAEQAS